MIASELDVVLGNPVVLGDEQATAIPAATLDAIAGTDTFPLTAPYKGLSVLHGKENLVVSQGGQKWDAIYEGMVNGPCVCRAGRRFRVQCHPDTDGKVSSMNFHNDWDEQLTKQ